jgi:hypothetical protein
LAAKKVRQSMIIRSQWAVVGDGLGQRQGFLDGLPVRGTAAAVALDFALHLVVVAGLRGGHKDDPSGTLAELLRVVALAAAHTPKHECHRIAGFDCMRRLWRRQGPGAKRDKIKKAASVLTSKLRQRGCFPALPSKLKTALVGIWPVS